MTVHRTKGEDAQLKAAKKDSEPDDENSVTDDDLSNILRSLTVLYGFFFVFLSAMVAGAHNLRTSLDSVNALMLYIFILLLAFACFMIGLEINRTLLDFGMSDVGEIGVRVLIALVPIVFVFVIGQALLADRDFFGIVFTSLGVWLISYIQLAVFVVIYFKRIRNK